MRDKPATGRNRSFTLFPFGVNAVGTNTLFSTSAATFTSTVSVTVQPCSGVILTVYCTLSVRVTMGSGALGLFSPVTGFHSYVEPIGLADNRAGVFAETITSV